MTPPDYDHWFRDYARLLTEALHGDVPAKALRRRYDDAFIAGGPDGVKTGRNGWLLSLASWQAARFHRKVGTVETRVETVEPIQLFEGFDAVRVRFSSDHRTTEGLRTLPFEITYLMRRTGAGEAKIFGFLAGDEMEVYRRQGLVDAKGRPTDLVVGPDDSVEKRS